MDLVLLDYSYIAKLCCEMVFNNIFLLFWCLISKPACFLLRSMENAQIKLKVYKGRLNSNAGFAGHRVRVPPDPIPNSEVKPCSVPNCSVVLGHVNLGKLAAYFSTFYIYSLISV